MKGASTPAKTGSSTHHRGKKVYTEEKAYFKNFAFRKFVPGQMELSIIIIGIFLWLLLAVFSAVAINYLQTKKNSTIIEKSTYSEIPVNLIPPAKRSSHWSPRVNLDNQFGALQDPNSSRINGNADLQQILNDSPPGYETPYRSK